MKPLRIAASIAGVTLMSSAAALAADLPAPQVIPHMPTVAPAPIEVGSGWYLRGDAGYAFTSDPAVEYDLVANGIGTDVWFENENLTNMFMLGAGFGYQFNQYFRADATLDYKFSGEFYANTGATGCGAGGVACTSLEQADLSLLTIMANAYVDLGHYYGFTPYIGAGLGASYVAWDNYTSTPARAGVTYTSDEYWALSAAAMAGVSYDVTDNLALDVGYRYQWVDGGNLVTDNFTGVATHDDLHLHEARIGLRYTLGGGSYYQPAPLDPVGPIVTKF